MSDAVPVLIFLLAVALAGIGAFVFLRPSPDDAPAVVSAQPVPAPSMDPPIPHEQIKKCFEDDGVPLRGLSGKVICMSRSAVKWMY